MMSESEEQEQAIAHWRAEAGDVSFAPGFADRVINRLTQPVVLVTPIIAMERVFFRLAPLAAAAVLLIAALNVFNSRASGQPLIDRVFGLPAVSLSAVYTFDTELSGYGTTGQ